MQTKLKLPISIIEKLSSLPEQGMGYQIVKVLLRSGIELKKRIVLNSTYLLIADNETITTAEIEDIELEIQQK